MALSKPSLETRIVSGLSGLGFDVNNEHAKVKDMAQVIASAVVDEIQANATVQPTAFVIGTPSGPGTITGTGTVT